MVLRMSIAFLIGIMGKKISHVSYHKHKILFCFAQCCSRKESVWSELDQLLREEDDTTISTPYTAVVGEYRVVIQDPVDASFGNKSWSNANGHAIVDAQHPCR